MFRNHKEHIARSLSGNVQAGNVKRLRVNITVHEVTKEFAECIGSDIRWRQHRLLRIQAGAKIIIVIGQNIDLGYCGGISTGRVKQSGGEKSVDDAKHRTISQKIAAAKGGGTPTVRIESAPVFK